MLSSVQCSLAKFIINHGPAASPGLSFEIDCAILSPRSNSIQQLKTHAYFEITFWLYGYLEFFNLTVQALVVPPAPTRDTVYVQLQINIYYMTLLPFYQLVWGSLWLAPIIYHIFFSLLTVWSINSTDIRRPSPLELEYVLRLGLVVTLAFIVHLSWIMIINKLKHNHCSGLTCSDMDSNCL